MKNAMILMMILGGGIQSFCQQQAGEIRNVSVEGFKQVMDSLKDEVLIDLRTPDELKGGKIAGALEIDFFAPGFEPAIEALDRDKVYLLYCASGARSGETVDIMHKMGFKNLYNLEGGFRAWVKQRLPVSKR